MSKFLKQLFSPQLPEDIGSVHISWSFPEYIREQKSKLWYVLVFVSLTAMIVYAIVTVNYLFAVILLLSAFTIVFQYFQATREIPVTIGEDGIIVDKSFYPYKVFAGFWLAYNPPEVKFLYLEFKNSIRKALPVPLEQMNPLEVREALLNYIQEDLEKDEEDFDETFSRMIKIR